ncbi:MAG: hypothetical protein RBT51_14765, partial [Ectothiorhodospiraceae bacterium]|nr:hypothetical protein [Ectothiorhodospiraceae bacterium]
MAHAAGITRMRRTRSGFEPTDDDAFEIGLQRRIDRELRLVQHRGRIAAAGRRGRHDVGTPVVAAGGEQQQKQGKERKTSHEPIHARHCMSKRVCGQLVLSVGALDGLVEQLPNPAHRRTPLRRFTTRGRTLFAEIDVRWTTHA